MKNHPKLRQLLALLLIGGSLSVLSAEDIDPNELFKNLEQRKDLSTQIQKLSELRGEQLTHRKLQPIILGLLKDESLNKSERLEAFKVAAELSIAKEALVQDDVAEVLLKIEQNLSSPNLKLFCVETLLNFDALKNTATEGKIAKLVQTIVADASLESNKQKYPATLHAACLKSIDGQKASAAQISNIEKLLQNESNLSPTLQIALYEVIGIIAEAKSPNLKKTTKNNFAKGLVDILSTQPAMAQIGASETELSNLKALIGPVGILLSDPDNSSYLEKGVDELVKGLQHKDLDVLRLSGQALVQIARSNPPKLKVEIDGELLKAIKGLDPKASDTLEREGQLFNLLSASLSVLLSNEGLKNADNRIQEILLTAHRTVMTHADIGMRIKAMDTLFVLEPRYFEGKILNSGSRKILKTFVSDCAGAMENRQLVESLPQLILRMSEVLHELTGRDFGTDSKLWNDWLRKEGKDYF